MNPTVEQILPVMAADAARIESGLRRLDQWLASHSGERGAFLLDLDGSAAIRERGLAAKRALVRPLQQLVRTATADLDAVVIDSGTRDEVLVAVAGLTAGELERTAERVLERIRRHPFRSEHWPGDHFVTASLGLSGLTPEVRAELVLAETRGALAAAKRDRDCARWAAESTTTRRVAVAELAADVGLDGRSLAEAAARGLRHLEEKYLPMWFWLAPEPRLHQAVLEAAADRSTVAGQVFLDLAEQILAESAEGPRGERLRAMPAELGPVLAVPMGAWAVDTLNKLAAALAVDDARLLAAALRLDARHAAVATAEISAAAAVR